MDLKMDKVIDKKELYYKKLSNDKVINITGEVCNEKSILVNEYRNDKNYLVVNYDLILLNPNVGTIEYELRQMLVQKYGNTIFENVSKIGIQKFKENFTIAYNEIINYFLDCNKVIVLDVKQLGLINDVSTIKGELVVLKSGENFLQNKISGTDEQNQKYHQEQNNKLQQLNFMTNELLNRVDIFLDKKNKKNFFDGIAIQDYLQENAKKYLTIIKDEYGLFMSLEQLQFLDKLLKTDCVKVELNGKKYLSNQANEINNSSVMSFFEKLQELRNLNTPLAHGGRVFEDDVVHFYPTVLLSQGSNLSVDELIKKCDEVLIHELLHFFIRPENLDITNKKKLKGINDFTTEGLVDMCARDIQHKYGLFPNYASEYGSNVIFVREILANISSLLERMQLVFNGSIEQIYQQTSTQTYDSQQQFVNSRDKQTKYDELITEISSICYSEKKKFESCRRFLYSFSADFKSKDEAIEAIEKVGWQQFGERMPLISQKIMNYRKRDESKNISLKSNEDLIDISKIAFNQRSDKEIKIAEQIRIKNKAIANYKKQQKGSENSKKNW